MHHPSMDSPGPQGAVRLPTTTRNNDLNAPEQTPNRFKWGGGGGGGGVGGGGDPQLHSK